MSTETGSNGSGELSDEQADRIIDRLMERAEDRDDVEFSRIEKKAVEMSRRQALTGAAGLLGVGALAASSMPAQAATGNWSNASGQGGTQDKPLTDTWARDAHFQTTDTEQLSTVRVATAFGGVLDGIKAAADDAGIGGTVLVPPGEYLADSSAESESFPDDVTFIGYGAILKMPDGSDWNSVISTGSSKGWHFKGITFDGNKANTTGQQYFFGTRGGSASGAFRFTDCTFKDCGRGYWAGNGGDHGTKFVNVNGENNGKTIDSPGQEVSVLGGHHTGTTVSVALQGRNASIKDVTVATPGPGFSLFLDGADYGTIEGCRVVGPGDNFDHIHADDGEAMRVVNNTAINGGDAGIVVYNPDSAVEDTVVANNTAIGNQTSGIRVLGGGPATVVGNTAKNNGQDTALSAGWKRAGIHVGAPNTTVVGNSCRDDQATKTQLYGVGVDDLTTDLELASNELTGNANGRIGYQSSRPDRVVLDGWSVNAGNPSAGGVWNGNGYEGVMVRDTTNLANYVYVNGGWVAL